MTNVTQISCSSLHYYCSAVTLELCIFHGPCVIALYAGNELYNSLFSFSLHFYFLFLLLPFFDLLSSPSPTAPLPSLLLSLLPLLLLLLFLLLHFLIPSPQPWSEMESSDDDTLSERSCVSEPSFRSERSGGSLSPCPSGPAGPPGDTLPWNLSKHERRKRKSQDSVLDPAERAVVRVAGKGNHLTLYVSQCAFEQGTKPASAQWVLNGKKKRGVVVVWSFQRRMCVWIWCSRCERETERDRKRPVSLNSGWNFWSLTEDENWQLPRRGALLKSQWSLAERLQTLS